VTKAFGLDLGFHHAHGLPPFAIVAIALGIGLGGRVHTSSGMPSWDTIAASRYLIRGDTIAVDTVDPGCLYACGEVSVTGGQLFT